jgi:hypothetical protein
VLLVTVGFSGGSRPDHIVEGVRVRSCKNSALPAVARKRAMMASSVRRARNGVMAVSSHNLQLK